MKFTLNIKSQFDSFNQHIGAKYAQYDPHDFANYDEVVFAQSSDYFIAVCKAHIG